MLLQVADGLWKAPFANPLSELDALKAVASFGVRIPETAVDAILAAAGPVLAANTRVSDTIAHLLVQTYWAVETRRQDLADVLATMLRLPEPPFNLWDLVQQMPAAARGPLRAVVVALADEGRRDAVEVLAHWREGSGAVQLAARSACAALLRRPIGIERTTTTVGTQESATVDLLLALLDADELVDVPPTELGPDKAQPAGGIFFLTSFVTGEANSGENASGSGTAQDATEKTTSPGDAAIVVQDATSIIPDDAALTAAGPPGELAVAVATHLTAIIEDERDGGTSRTHAVCALRLLVNRLPPAIAGQLAQRLAVVHQAPRHSEADLWEMSTDTALSRTRISTGTSDLAGLALLTSVEAFVAAHAGAGVTDADRVFADHAIASAAQLLRDDEPQARQLGACTVTAIATVAPEFSGYATGLLFHGDEHVRALGAAKAPATPEMYAVLAQDPAPRVRAAVARRASELPEAVRHALAGDSHLVVRRGIMTGG